MILMKLRTDVHGARQVVSNVALLAGSIVMTAGCVNVAAPDKPIEINLNINIRQEVLVKLERDVQDLINKNPGVF